MSHPLTTSEKGWNPTSPSRTFEKVVSRAREIASASAITAEANGRKKLVWSCWDVNDWEILVYQHGDLWEACFFRWAIHHEHAIGSSFDSVRIRAKERIRILEARNLKSAVWRE